MGLLVVLIYGLITLLTLFVVLVLLLGKKPKMIFNTYPAKDVFFKLKYYVSLWMLRHIRLKLYDPSKRAKCIEELEKPKILGESTATYDIISFVAANKAGETLLIFMERRRRGLLKICLYLYLPTEGLYCLPKNPDMIYFSTDGKEENSEFRGVGFHIFPEQYMRRWRIRYAGPLRKEDTDEVVNVKMDLVFSATPQYFDYNRDLSTAVIADSVAREAWDSKFLKILLYVEKALEKRIHYEQVGTLSGNIGINDERILILEMKGYRDHNFGTERCLSEINRYVYMALFFDNGTTIMVGNISQPSFMLSSLKVGYICYPDGHYDPITDCNFELYAYGEKGTPPQRTNFIVSTARETHFVQIEERHIATKFSGGNWKSKIFNQFVKCSSNGISGTGVTEFLYRHDGGRPEACSADDPDWYREDRHMKNCTEYEDDHFGLEFE